MKKCLFIDDSVERHDACVKKYIIPSWAIHVKNYEQAIFALLTNTRFEVIFFDHDLCEDMTNSSFILRTKQIFQNIGITI